jgi:hypothetical protein
LREFKKELLMKHLPSIVGLLGVLCCATSCGNDEPRSSGSGGIAPSSGGVEPAGNDPLTLAHDEKVLHARGSGAHVEYAWDVAGRALTIHLYDKNMKALQVLAPPIMFAMVNGEEKLLDVKSALPRGTASGEWSTTLTDATASADKVKVAISVDRIVDFIFIPRK